MLAAALLIVAALRKPLDVSALLRDARAVVAREGDQVWPGLSRAPFGVDVIGAEQERLFCHAPAPRAGFVPHPADPATGCPLQVRPRRLDPDLAAESPVPGLPGPGVVQIGEPQLLGATRAEWIVTVVHEHFHQFQAASSSFAATERAMWPPGALDASWMLDYPFPYADPEVGRRMGDLGRAAVDLFDAKGVAVPAAVGRYAAARRAFTAAVPDGARRYLEFQVGTEGVARWTETAVGRAAGVRDPELAVLAAERQAGFATSFRAIQRQGLGVWKRNLFYVLGPADIAALDGLAASWRADYLRDPFSFGRRLEAACAASPSCRVAEAQASTPREAASAASRSSGE